MEAHPIIPSLRSSSRLLVRELGFMSSNLAGTSYSPSAVHAIVEIGLHEKSIAANTHSAAIAADSTARNKSSGITAATLCLDLNLEKSSVSRMLKKLVEAGEIREGYGEDAREKVLELTQKGRRTLADIDAYGVSQISAAFAQLPATLTPDDILKGISAYANALRSSRLNITPAPTPAPTIHILPGYRPGILARCLTMHMNYYTPAFDFGVDFESMLSTGLGELLGRLDDITAQAWAAVDSHGVIRGTVFMDGVDLSREPGVFMDHQHLDAAKGETGKKAHLRAVIVDEGMKGLGVGKRMLRSAVEWADERGYGEVHLWTLGGLNAARRLYEGAGFALWDEVEKPMWEGKILLVQHLVRVKPEGL